MEERTFNQFFKSIRILAICLSILIFVAVVVCFFYRITHKAEIRVVLDTNPPNIAIINWQINTHQIGIEEVSSYQIRLNINGTNYSFALSEISPVKASGKEITIYEGIEAGVTYELIDYDGEKITISAYEWAAPPADRYLSRLYRPEIVYEEERYTDYQLFDNASILAEDKDPEGAVRMCLQMSSPDSAIPVGSEVSSVFFPDNCLEYVAKETAKYDYAKATAACRGITEESAKSDCLSSVKSISEGATQTSSARSQGTAEGDIDEELIRTLILEDLGESTKEAVVNWEIKVLGNAADVDVHLSWGRGLCVGYHYQLSKSSEDWIISEKERTIVC